MGDVVKAGTGENPHQREQGPQRKRMERRSTAAQTGADRAAGQRDAGPEVGAAKSAAQNENSDMMLKYRWNGVLCWCAGGVRRAAVRSRAALPGALEGILSIRS